MITPTIPTRTRKMSSVCVSKTQSTHTSGQWCSAAANLIALGRKRPCWPIISFHQLHRLHPGESKQHRHAAWGLTKENTCATSAETAYPFELARDIANVFITILLQRGAEPPAQSLTDIKSQSEHVLQATRARTGSQPRAAKLPPLVPEFTRFITSAALASQESVPNAKLLSTNPFASSQMKGGDLCDSLESDGSLAKSGVGGISNGSLVTAEKRFGTCIMSQWSL